MAHACEGVAMIVGSSLGAHRMEFLLELFPSSISQNDVISEARHARDLCSQVRLFCAARELAATTCCHLLLPTATTCPNYHLAIFSPSLHFLPYINPPPPQASNGLWNDLRNWRAGREGNKLKWEI